jgi:putative membrane protein
LISRVLDYFDFRVIYAVDIRLLISKGVLMKKVTIILILITLLIWCSSVFAAPVTKEQDKALSLDQALQEILNAQGVSDVKSIDCSKVTEKQLEDLGDAYMDVMHPGSSEHEFMDRMMGGEKSPTLVSMKRLMGARYIGCYKGEVPFGGMMGPMYRGRGYGDDYHDRRWPHMSMMYGNGPCGMMGPYGGIFMWIVFVVILVIVIYLVIRWARPTGVGETPLEILKRRYAKGEITKDEFEQKKKDLGL